MNSAELRVPVRRAVGLISDEEAEAGQAVEVERDGVALGILEAVADRVS